MSVLEEVSMFLGKDVAGIVDNYLSFKKAMCFPIIKINDIYDCKILNNKLWIACTNDIYIVTLPDGKFTHPTIAMVDKKIVKYVKENFTRVFAYNGHTYIIHKNGIFKFDTNDLIASCKCVCKFSSVKAEIDARYVKLYHSKTFVFNIRNIDLYDGYEYEIHGLTYEELFEGITEMKLLKVIKDKKFDKEYLINNLDMVHLYRDDEIPICIYERNGRIHEVVEPDKCFICGNSSNKDCHYNQYSSWTIQNTDVFQHKNEVWVKLNNSTNYVKIHISPDILMERRISFRYLLSRDMCLVTIYDDIDDIDEWYLIKFV